MQITTEIDLDAPAKCAWRVLGERFGDIASWTCSLESSQLEGELGRGAIRICQSAQAFGPFPAARIREELVDFDREHMRLHYRALRGIPRMMRSAENRWRIEALSPERCRVVSVATLSLAWWARPLAPLLAWMLRAPMAGFKEELRRAVEQERAHARDSGTQVTV